MYDRLVQALGERKEGEGMIKTIDDPHNFRYGIQTYVFTEEEKKQVDEIMNKLKQIFQCQNVSLGCPDGISGTSDYQDMVIRLDGCYMPYAKRVWRSKE